MTISEPELGAILVTLARAVGLAATAPVLGDSGVPLRARLVFVLAVSAAVGGTRGPVELADVPPLATLELATGLLEGTVARFVVARVAVAGQLMGLSLGLGFASQYDPHAGESATTMRTLLSTLASLAFISAGGLEAIAKSIAAAPANVGELAALGEAVVRHGGSAMQHGLALAAPIVLAALVGNLGLAVMNRAAPAVNVFSVALAAVLILGGVVLLVSSAHVVGGITDAVHAAIAVLVG